MKINNQNAFFFIKILQLSDILFNFALKINHYQQTIIMKQKEFMNVKQHVATLAIAICCVMTSTVFTACSNEDDPAPYQLQTDLVLHFGDITIQPYLAFGTSLAQAENYFKAEFSDYSQWEIDGVGRFDHSDGFYYYKDYYNDERSISFDFSDADCKYLCQVGYNFYSPMSPELVMDELERNGFKNLGLIRFPEDGDDDISYFYLSADGTLEVLIAFWNSETKDKDCWSICFQPLDENDLKYLVKQ